MSVVIVGGNECMVCQYEKICREYGCKAKVLVKEKGNIKKKLGNPDLMILFTKAKRNQIQIARAHSSSASALTSLLQQYCVG